MEPELEPTQPPEVADAVAELLVEPDSGPDPWWQAGIEDALSS